ncbi:concanavalin A-like lectin/glucanase [Tanacetum coccineum]
MKDALQNKDYQMSKAQSVHVSLMIPKVVLDGVKGLKDEVGDSDELDNEVVVKAYLNIVVGACISLVTVSTLLLPWLRFASSKDGRAHDLLYSYVVSFFNKGTLEGCLRKVGTSLSWLQWLNICIGAARGLDYLHMGTGTKQEVIHRDVKSSNILLDASYAAKISDFGLAKVGPTNLTDTFVNTGVKGTFGYMDLMYFYINKLTRKSDLYAFGVFV